MLEHIMHELMFKKIDRFNVFIYLKKYFNFLFILFCILFGFWFWDKMNIQSASNKQTIFVVKLDYHFVILLAKRNINNLIATTQCLWYKYNKKLIV